MRRGLREAWVELGQERSLSVPCLGLAPPSHPALCPLQCCSHHPELCWAVDMAGSPLDLELWAGAGTGLVHIQFPTAWPIENVPSFLVECTVKVTHTINRYPPVLQQEFLFSWPHSQPTFSFSLSIVPTRVQLCDSNF